MKRLKDLILRVVETNAPMTVRQVFYQLTTLGAIEKSEAEYKTTVVRLLTAMRLDGTLPFRCIADNTRWMRKPRTFSSLQHALRTTAETYRRATWDNQASYVEIWLEKDALSGVVYQETGNFDVPLMVTRGYPSVSYLHAAAETILECNKPAFLYYLGDHDPSGVDISRNVEKRLLEFAAGAEIHFVRLAVTPAQIAQWTLPARPTKKSDSRAREFEGNSVEVDAIPPARLRELVRRSIEKHIDHRALEVLCIAEKSEREVLDLMVSDVARDGQGRVHGV